MSNPQVELHIANYGTITLELDAEKAPLASPAPPTLSQWIEMKRSAFSRRAMP